MSRLAIVVVASALVASADAAPRAGRVVRIERGAHGPSGTPRWCRMNTSDLGGFCIGKQPAVGEQITLVDRDRVLGVVAVASTSPYMAACNDGTVWLVQGRLDAGDLAASQGGATIGVIDIAIDPRAGKLVTVDPSRTPLGTSVPIDNVQAIDSDGDGAPDVEIVEYACDERGNPSATGQDGRCLDLWMTTRKHRFERVHRDRIRSC